MYSEAWRYRSSRIRSHTLAGGIVSDGQKSTLRESHFLVCPAYGACLAFGMPYHFITMLPMTDIGLAVFARSIPNESESMTNNSN
jgi:hypothetical protein